MSRWRDAVTLFCWQVFEDGEWNIIGAALPGVVETTPLVTTRAHLADLLGAVAVAHHDRTGLPVRKVVYENPTVLREVP